LVYYTRSVFLAFAQDTWTMSAGFAQRIANRGRCNRRAQYDDAPCHASRTAAWPKSDLVETAARTGYTVRMDSTRLNLLTRDGAVAVEFSPALEQEHYSELNEIACDAESETELQKAVTAAGERCGQEGTVRLACAPCIAEQQRFKRGQTRGLSKESIEPGAHGDVPI